jgi:hypothetical protein
MTQKGEELRSATNAHVAKKTILDRDREELAKREEEKVCVVTIDKVQTLHQDVSYSLRGSIGATRAASCRGGGQEGHQEGQ